MFFEEAGEVDARWDGVVGAVGVSIEAYDGTETGDITRIV